VALRLVGRPRAVVQRVRVVTDRTGWRYFVGFGLGRLSGLLVIPVVGHLLGPAGVGQFEIALAIILATAIVFDAGVGAAVLRFAQDTRYTRSEVIAAAGAVQSMAIVVAAMLFIPVMVLAGPDRQPAWALSFVLVGFCAVEGFAVLGSAIIRTEENDRLYLRLGIQRLILTAGFGTGGVVVADVPGALFGVALGGLSFAFIGWRRWWAVRGLGSARARNRIARYGVPLIATTVSTWCLSLSDRLFLRASVSADQLGQYAANYRFGSVLITFLAAPVALMWLPEAQRALPELRAALERRWMAGVTAVSVAAVLLLVAVSGTAIPLVFGPEFHVDHLVVAAVGAAGWLAALYYLVATPLLLTDSTLYMSVSAVIAVAVALGLNATLIPAHGAHGAAVATFGAYVTLTGATFLLGLRVRKRGLS
jgi:O-antigen/teichoic acid export membrane protein